MGQRHQARFDLGRDLRKTTRPGSLFQGKLQTSEYKAPPGPNDRRPARVQGCHDVFVFLAFACQKQNVGSFDFSCSSLSCSGHLKQPFVFRLAQFNYVFLGHHPLLPGWRSLAYFTCQNLFVEVLAIAVVFVVTRVTTAFGAESGAANQAIRQTFIFSALGLDAFALTTQSLVGYFYGAGELKIARRVVKLAIGWSMIMGIVLSTILWFGRDLVIRLMVPESAVALFLPAWLVLVLAQPINAITFMTDGAHWGTGDFRFMRNAMVLTTLIAVPFIFAAPAQSPNQVAYPWLVVLIWLALRGLLGIVRIWPGIGQARFQIQREVVHK